MSRKSLKRKAPRIAAGVSGPAWTLQKIRFGIGDVVSVTVFEAGAGVCSFR